METDVNPMKNDNVIVKIEQEVLDISFTDNTDNIHIKPEILSNQNEDLTKSMQESFQKIIQGTGVKNIIENTGLNSPSLQELNIQTPPRRGRVQRLKSPDSILVDGTKVYPCDVCQKTYSQKYNLMRHKLLHTEGKKFNCTDCAKAFADKYQLQKHMLTHTNKKPFNCEVCNRGFVERYALKIHMMTHTKERPYACACGLRFSQIGALNRHKSGKYTQKSFQCDLCSKVFKQKAHIIRHIASHSGVRDFTCKVCDKTFLQQTHLNVHMLVHEDDKHISCDVCKKTFRTAQHMKRHRVTHKSAEPLPAVTKTLKSKRHSKKAIVENNEKFKTQVEDSLKQYLGTVIKQEPGIETDTANFGEPSQKLQGCPFSGPTLYSPTVSKQKPKQMFACKLCDKSFPKQSRLNRHEIIHSGIRNHKCNVCNKSFYIKYQLDDHMVTHTGFRRFTCDICQDSFYRKAALERHKQMHSDKKRVSCDLCHKSFRAPISVIRHKESDCKMIVKSSSQDSKPDLKSIDQHLQEVNEYDSDKRLYIKQEFEDEKGQEKNEEIVNPYICSRCRRLFNKRHLIIKHLQTENCVKVELSQCKYCYKFFQPSQIQIHESVHTEVKPHQCKICPKRFLDTSEFSAHMALHESIHECKFCKKKYYTKYDLHCHMKIHIEKPFKCDQCNKSFTQRRNLKSHMLIHSGKRKYFCNVCGKSFKNYHYMTRHLRTYHKSNKSNAKEIEITENTDVMPTQDEKIVIKVEPKDVLVNYEGDENEEAPEYIVPEPVPTNSTKKYFNNDYQCYCDRCQQGFKHKKLLIEHLVKGCEFVSRSPCEFCIAMIPIHNLSEHLQTHSCEKPYFCIQCAMNFSQRSELDNHRLIHKGEKPYSCQICSKSFALKSQLRKHRFVHTEEKPYKCGICGKSYSRKTYLTEHKRTHSGETPFNCNVCEKSYSRLCTLKVHKLIHSQDKHTCHICNKTFNQKVHFETHMLVHKNVTYTCDVCYNVYSNYRYFLKHKKSHLDKKTKDINIINNDESNKKNTTEETVVTNTETVATNTETVATNTETVVKNTEPLENPNKIDVYVENQPIIVKIESQQNYSIKQEPSNYTNEDIPENIQHQETIEHSEYTANFTSFLDNVNRDKNTHQEVEAHYQTGEYSGNYLLNTDGEATPEVNNDSFEEYENLESINMLEPQIEMVSVTMTEEIEARSYRDGAEFVCRQCERRFTLKYSLIVHLKANICNKTKLAKCRYCYKDYNIKYITAHERTHTGELQYCCDICKKSFARSSSLAQHKLTHQDDKLFDCDECGKKFTQKCTLTRHKYTHSKEKIYPCDICDKTFGRSSILAQHKLTHNDEKQFTCNVCNKKFTRIHNLKLHEKSHIESIDIPRLPCDECDKTFTSISNLKRHKQSHNRDVWYKCDVCNKPFSRESYLSKHKLIHTGEKPFACDSCDLMFRFSHALTKHKKRAHMPKSETLETQDSDKEMKYDDSLENLPSCSSDIKSELSTEIKTDPNEITIDESDISSLVVSTKSTDD